MDKELEAIKQIIEALDSLEIEEKKRVLDYVFNRLGLKSIKSDEPSQFNIVSPNEPSQYQERPENIVYPSTIKDIKSLKEEKQPQTAIQMVALVAYYLSEIAPIEERKNTINSEDITKYFKQARFELPKGEPIYTLRNARNSGYFDSTSETGVYKLNPVGYNLVAHNLPGNNKNIKRTKKGKIRKLSKNKKTK
jgi:hypothetical protein